MKSQSRQSQPDLPRVKRRTLTFIVLGAVFALGLAFVIGFFIRHRRLKHREAMAKEVRNQPLVVQVAKPKPTQGSFELNLPADVRAYASTSLYARASGYLASWTADINDHVKKGQVLAVISAPDTDAQLEQAQAALGQQQSTQRIAKLTDDRYRGLIAIHGVTQQQLDQNRAQLEQSESNVKAAVADVHRLQTLVDYEKIIAPFDGIVTARNYDVGALISATSIGSGQQLFDLAEVDRLRVFVSVPQTYVMLIKFGQPVTLSLERNYPGHKFTGVVTRSTGSLDQTTRTLRTELDFTNNDPVGPIYPGMFAEATFTIRRTDPVLTVPTSALLFEADGKQVAVVTPQNKVHFQKIVPGSDFGQDIEIISGLKGDERIVVNPGEQLMEGMAVSPRTGQADGKGGQAKPEEKKDDEKKGGGS